MGACTSDTNAPEADVTDMAQKDEQAEQLKRRTAQQRRKLSLAPAKVGPIVNKGEGGDVTEDDFNVGLTDIEKEARGTLHHHAVSVKGVIPYSQDKVNQDRPLVKYAVGDDPTISMFGVMDGHGEIGHVVSQYIMDSLPVWMARQKDIKADPEAALLAAVKACSDALDAKPINTKFSGSTLVFGLLIDRKDLWVANIGDSRCVLGVRQPDGSILAHDLSEDQKPENPGEHERIIACGGRVDTLPGDPEDDLGPPRVWLADVDIPGLAMSRSLGDQVSKKVGVISVPEIRHHELTENDEFVIFASDGVWEFISSQTAADIVWKLKGDYTQACRDLVEKSIDAWREQEEVIDDTTCVVLSNLTDDTT